MARHDSSIPPSSLSAPLYDLLLRLSTTLFCKEKPTKERLRLSFQPLRKKSRSFSHFQSVPARDPIISNFFQEIS